MITDDLLQKLPVNSQDVNVLTNKGGEIRVLISPKTVKSTKLILGRVVLKPDEELVEHLHDYGEETFYVSKGSGEVFIDNNRISLSPDSAILVPQGSKHRVINTGSEDLILIFATAPLAPKAALGDRVVVGK